MADWSGGYVTDTEYSRAFQREQTPSHLDLVCLLNGIAPPDGRERISYCDLGCGHGYTATLLAAANPGIDFWGIDFNPAHIAGGRAFQAEIGLSNLHLHEYAFSDLVGDNAPELPQFDYVTMHGIYSWVGPAERHAITRFLGTHLKPGGLVYVGYNSLPSWTSEMPFQRVLSTHGRFSRDRSDRAVEQGIAFAKRLREAGAKELNRPDIIEKLDNLIAMGRQRYLAHEYLTTQWTPMYHEDVARELTQAKLDYVGSAMLLENFLQLCLTPAQRQLCEEFGGPVVFETLKDFFVTRGFRSDVYVRGKRPLSIAQQTARMRDIELGLLVPLNELRYEFTVPVGKSQLNEKLYRPIFETLSQAPATIGNLLDHAQVATTTATPVELAGMLVGSGQAIRHLKSTDAGRRGALTFNTAVARRAVTEGEGYAALSAPAAGSGAYLTQAQTLVYAQMAAGTPRNTEALAAAIAQDLARQGTQISAGGKPLASAEETLAALRIEIAPMLEGWLPLWRQLGVI
jgi:SAM-dependent methyltransferase